MAPKQTLIASLLAGVCQLALAQQPGEVAEVHPPLPSWKCTRQGCVQQNTTVVLDWEYRDIHVKGGTTSCKGGSGQSASLAGNGVNPSQCPDAATCAKNCVVEGADYASWGVSTSGNALTLKHYVNGKSASPRVYLLGEDGNYVMMSLLNGEFSVDVDYSKYFAYS
jgi:cellulase